MSAYVVVTISTVGYGDRFPVTVQGRVVAVGLMLVGIAIVGAVTATIAAWLVSQVEQDRTRADAGDESQTDPTGNAAARPTRG